MEDIDDDLVDLEVDTDEVHLDDQVEDTVVDQVVVPEADIVEEALVDLLLEDTDEVHLDHQVEATAVVTLPERPVAMKDRNNYLELY